jgi:predicted ATP-grasp superfamily ATP-dependent carboligase
MAGRALAVAAAACRLIPGLKGFVGVDVVLTATEAWVIEVNPRITTAYVGLRLACPFNLAGALIKAATRGQLANTCPRLRPHTTVAW